MNSEYTPTFFGPTAKRDSLIYAKYALADRILMSVADLGEHIRIRVEGNPDPIDVIDVEAKNLDIYGDLYSPKKAYDILINIDGVGEKTVNKVLSKINNLLNLCKATVRDFESIGVGHKRAILLVKGIEKYLKEM